MAELTKEQKRGYAQTLYLTDLSITQKEIAERTGVTEATISRWVNTYNWESMRVSLLVTKEEQLSLMYSQLAAANAAIAARDEGARFPTSKEADAILKTTTSIGKLETDTNVGEKMATGREFLAYVRRVDDFQISKSIATLFDGYIKTCLK